MGKKLKNTVISLLPVLILLLGSLVGCQSDKCKLYNYTLKAGKQESLEEIGEEIVCKCRDSSTIHLGKTTISFFDYYHYTDSFVFSQKHLLPIPTKEDYLCTDYWDISLACVEKKKEYSFFTINGSSWKDCVEYSFTHWTPNGKIFKDSGKVVFSFHDSIVVHYEYNDLRGNIFTEEISDVFYE